jgi:hypothetical protein
MLLDVLLVVVGLSAICTVTIVVVAWLLWRPPPRPDHYDQLLAQADEAEATVDRVIRDRIAA